MCLLTYPESILNSEVHVHAKSRKRAKMQTKTAIVIIQFQLVRSGVAMRENLKIHKRLASSACISSSKKTLKMNQREE